MRSLAETLRRSRRYAMRRAAGDEAGSQWVVRPRQRWCINYDADADGHRMMDAKWVGGWIWVFDYRAAPIWTINWFPRHLTAEIMVKTVVRAAVERGTEILSLGTEFDAINAIHRTTYRAAVQW